MVHVEDCIITNRNNTDRMYTDEALVNKHLIRLKFEMRPTWFEARQALIAEYHKKFA